MRKHIAVYLLTSVLAILYMTSCESDNYLNKTRNNDPISIMKVETVPLLDPRYEGEDSSARVVAYGANDFAFQLSAALIQDARGENFIVSPYSVWLPLAALLNATNDAYQEELLTVLGASGINPKDVNRAVSRMLFDLTNEQDRDFSDYHNPLQIVNAVFVDHNMTPLENFAQDFVNFYRGSVINVDFKSLEAVEAINNWASDHTEGLIRNLVQGFNPETVAAIANAIYFSDRWHWEFSSEQTIEEIFYAPSGESITYFMQREGRDQLYFEDENLQAIHLEFATGGGMSILLPRSGDAVDLLSSMTNESFEYTRKNATLREGRLLMPRFSIENSIELVEVLTALGIPLFDEIAAPLSGIIYEESTWLSSAMQKAMIEVDERGTTATAVTVIAIEAVSVEEPESQEPFEMICNSPFVFVLHRQSSDGANQILFIGIVNQP